LRRQEREIANAPQKNACRFAPDTPSGLMPPAPSLPGDLCVKNFNYSKDLDF
jgi:hypothetical protein